MHSIKQELTMTRSCTLDEAEDIVEAMIVRVAEGEKARDVLASEGLAYYGAWACELNEGDDIWEPAFNEHRACYGD